MKPVLQLALDFVDLERAVAVAREAVAGGVDWIEAGTPLIKSEGLDAVRRLRAEFPKATIVADLKTMDAGRAEVEIAAKAGASVALVLGVAADGTLKECFDTGRNHGIKVGVDLIRVPDPVARAAQAQEWGASLVVAHTGIDEQMRGETPFDLIRRVAAKVTIPVAAAGGLNSETVVDAINAGATILIVGGAISKSSDARAAAKQIAGAIHSGKRAESALYKRASPANLREMLLKVSTANISDAAHRAPCMEGIRPVAPGLRMVGTAVTVRTLPGDWSKPVQAIDAAQPGDVIVIDACGRGPAVWGELATHSALQRRLAGVVIDGAIRDTSEILSLKFPAFARLILSNAGEPQGLGQISCPITAGGLRVEPGDWIVGDDDGVVVIPAARAVEIANYALDCMERENRIRGEIEKGATTLGKVADLLRWDKKSG